MTARFALAQQAAPAAPGNVDFVSAGAFGGGLPVGAIFWTSLAFANDTPQADAFFSLGAADGTNQWAIGMFSSDDAVTTVSQRIAHSDLCITAAVATPAPRASFVQFLPDGVRVNFTSTTNGVLVNCLLVDCDGFAVGPVTVLGPGGTDTVVNVGFRPGQVWLGSVALSFNGALNSTTAPMSFGVGDSQGGGAFFNGSRSIVEQNGQADGEPYQMIRDDAAVANLNQADGSFLRGAALVGVSGNGFTLRHVAGSSATNVLCGFMAFDFGLNQHWADVVSTSDAVGVKAYAPGFEPVMVGFSQSAVLTSDRNTPLGGDARAGLFDLGFASIPNAQEMTAASAQEPDVTPTNTGAQGDNARILNSVVASMSVLADGYVATVDVDDQGFSLDFTNIPFAGDDVDGLALAVGEAPGRVGGNRRPHFNSARWRRDRWRFD